MRNLSIDHTARLLTRALLNLARQHSLPSYRFAETFEGMRLTVGIKPDSKNQRDESPDLPDSLRLAMPKVKRAWRALRDIRGKGAADLVVTSMYVRNRIAEEDGDQFESIHTTRHSLQVLCDMNLAHKTEPLGYFLRPHQPSLPIPGWQTADASPSEIVAYASTMRDHFGIRRFVGGGPIMPKQRIWVPVEKTEFGILATDAETEELIPVTEEKVEKMTVPTKGKSRQSDAARGELIEVDGRCAVVKLSGRTVRVRVLGDWHLKGLQAPEVTTVA